MSLVRGIEAAPLLLRDDAANAETSQRFVRLGTSEEGSEKGGRVLIVEEGLKGKFARIKDDATDPGEKLCGEG